MKNFILSLLTGVICLIATAQAQATNITLQSTHAIVSEQQMPSGATAVTIRLNITNPSASVLSNLSFEPIGPDFIVAPGTSALAIASLAAGATVVVDWNLELIGLPLMPGLPLILAGTATNQADQSVDIIVSSGGI